MNIKIYFYKLFYPMVYCSMEITHKYCQLPEIDLFMSTFMYTFNYKPNYIQVCYFQILVSSETLICILLHF